ncbi:unnamed protein product [Boreogadus saida]
MLLITNLQIGNLFGSQRSTVMTLYNGAFDGAVLFLVIKARGTRSDIHLSQCTNALAIIQMCGVLFSPWNGLIFDRHKDKPRAAGETESESDLRAAVLSLALTALLSVLFSVSASVPLLPLQYLTFILQVLSRSFLYGGNAFAMIVFPFSFTILINGLLGGDPLWVNVVLTLLCLLAFLHPLYVHLHCRKLASQRCQKAGDYVSS